MEISRIMYLKQEAENEALSYEELAEIEEAFAQIPDDELRDERENATAVDMLCELEERISPIEWTIWNWVFQNFGESEANDPSWSIGGLAEEINNVAISFGDNDRTIGEVLAEQ